MDDDYLNEKMKDINILSGKKRKVSFANYAYEYDAGYDSDDDNSSSSDEEQTRRCFKKMKIDIEIDTSKKVDYVPYKKNNGLNTTRVYNKAFNLIKNIKNKKEDDEKNFEKDLNYIESKIRTSNGFAGDINNNRNIVFLPCNNSEKINDDVKFIK